jgi:hypothetical protein
MKRKKHRTKRRTYRSKRKTTRARRKPRHKRKVRKFATSWHKYQSEVAARNRREDIKKYGSLAKARAARKEWQKKFLAEQQEALKREGWWNNTRRSSPPSYVSATPSVMAPDVRDRYEKLMRLAKSDNVHEATLARQRAQELLRRSA